MLDETPGLDVMLISPRAFADAASDRSTPTDASTENNESLVLAARCRGSADSTTRIF
jgi:hypothetical protein